MPQVTSSDEHSLIISNDNTSSSEFLNPPTDNPLIKKRKLGNHPSKRKADFYESSDEVDVENIENVPQKDANPLSTDTMWIKSIYLENFMCHAHFQLDLNQNINFIVGQNGSGKSSVLSAIIIALGGTSAFSDRGRNLRNLIKDGHKSATIRLTIDNTKYPYQYERFGASIVIERRLDSANGHWKLLSESNLCIYKDKKSVVSMVEDHFNIVVNNPLNVLTQENAKKFLFSSSVKNKYDFFKRATRLSEVEEWLETAYKNYMKSKTIMTSKIQNLSILESKKKQSQTILNRVEQAQHASTQISSIITKILWAMVYECEKSKEICESDLVKLREFSTKLKLLVESTHQKLSNTKDSIEKLKVKESECLDLRDPSVNKSEMIKNAIKSNKSKVNDLNRKKSILNKQIEAESLKLDHYNKRLESEVEQFSTTQQSRINQVRIELAHAHKEREGFLKLLDEKNSELDKHSKMKQKFEKDVGSHVASLNELKSKGLTIRAEISEMQSAERNKINAIGGSTMELIINTINQSDWKFKPLGPIGLHVQLKSDYSQFHRILDSILARNMTDFIVFTQSDLSKLKSIMKQYKYKPSITLRSRELFDFSSGVINDQTTFYSILSIDNEYVTRHLIDSYRIESLALFKDRESCMSCNNSKIIKSYYPIQSSKMSGYELSKNNKQSKWLALHRGASPFAINQGVLIKEARNSLTELSNQQRVLELELNKVKLKASNSESASRAVAGELKELSNKNKQLNKKVDELVKSMNVEQAENDGLVKQINDSNAIIQSYQKQLKLYNSEIVDTESLISEDISRESSLQLNANKCLEEIREIKAHARNLNQILTDQELEYNKNIKDLNINSLAIEKRQDDLVEISFKLESLSSKVSGERIEVKESLAQLKATKEQLDKVKNDIEQRENVTYEDALTRYAEDARTFDEANSMLEQFDKIINCLKMGITIRKQKLEAHRNMVTASAKQSFLYLTKRRGYSGTLEINHEEKTLDIKLAVEQDQILRIQNKKKLVSRDVKSLSGGEKSYASVCFLCSLWHHVPSPLRCLDEYDVFMDPLTRQIAIGILMESAESTPCQYILISPQDASTLKDRDNMKIHVLKPPARG
eukprot:NODE_12_length_45166_cov_0.552511.p2 type:complete len:1104 gc:universal NODE_12_length_45166_cov_0.552511:30976-27665(-)